MNDFIKVEQQLEAQSNNSQTLPLELSNEEEKVKENNEEQTTNTEDNQDLIKNHSDNSYSSSDEENVKLFRSEDLESYVPSRPSTLLAFQKKEETSEEEEDDHHILSPVVRKHIKDNHITPIGLTKNKKLFMELFHQTMPKSITTTEDPEEKQSLAATMLQKVVRGWVVRKRYAKRRIDNARLSAEFTDEQGLIQGFKLKKKKLTESEVKEQCKKIEHAIGATIFRMKEKERVMNESAKIVQKAWRNYYRVKKEQIRQQPILPNECAQLINRISNSKYLKNRESFDDIIESVSINQIYGIPSYEMMDRPARSYTFKITIF
ncbi:predicted protein [Naegleria gruberi]|uniref:Predicted protein n=1 Tax=Naegleria gruberi TaxID=5762 RepID=D2V4Q0_NAEGR|nr:uncharacterized protein NAEGRDRAFT_63867 [Naegleria gruberi]EFC47970.1 predicted protein [Naegleria gruberi]|eukprot:XP_002680714.1 predicted protein [Naegleria gruberi strain NEG-M]